jgi:hypothetical protein
VLGPLNLLVRKKPEDIGLLPDGASRLSSGAKQQTSNIVDPAWAAIEWTLARAVRTSRFWWIVVGYFCALVAWYAVQVHQTKYLTDRLHAAHGGLVSRGGERSRRSWPDRPRALSDRVGREWVWTAGCAGFAICYAALIGLEYSPAPALLYLMVISQGFLGYALTSVMGPIVAEIFEGPHYGSIFGTITVALIGGGAMGPGSAARRQQCQLGNRTAAARPMVQIQREPCVDACPLRPRS